VRPLDVAQGHKPAGSTSSRTGRVRLYPTGGAAAHFDAYNHACQLEHVHMTTCSCQAPFVSIDPSTFQAATYCPHALRRDPALPSAPPLKSQDPPLTVDRPMTAPQVLRAAPAGSQWQRPPHV
jgi:hypothetical protein